MFPLSVCVNLDRKRGNVLFPGAGALAEGTPGRGRGRGARKEQEGVWGGCGCDTGDAALCPPPSPSGL